MTLLNRKIVLCAVVAALWKGSGHVTRLAESLGEENKATNVPNQIN